MKEKFLFSLLSRYLIQIFNVIASYIFILYLDVELIGIWGLLNSIVNIGFITADLGLVKIHLQYSEKRNFDDYFSSFFTIKLLLILINLGFSFLLITIFELWQNPFLNILFLLILSRIIIEFLNVFEIQITAKIKIFKLEIPSLIFNILFYISKIYIALNIEFLKNPLFWLSISSLIFLFLKIIMISFFSINEFHFSRPKKPYIFSYLKDTKPLMIYTIISIFTTNFGNVLIDILYGHENLAYFYVVSTLIIPTLFLISSVFFSTCFPLFSRYLANGNNITVERIIQIIEKYVSIIFLTIIIIIFLAGDLAFSIFLPNYYSSLPILYILIFHAYFQEISHGYGMLLNAGKKQKLSSFLSSLKMFFQLILIIVLVPINLFSIKMAGLGSIGFAFAIIIPTILFNLILSRIIVKKIFGIKSQKQILLQFCFAVFSFFIMVFIRELFLYFIIQYEILIVFISTALSIIVFFSLLFIFKILKKEDILFFKQIFNIKNYISSFKEEFY